MATPSSRKLRLVDEQQDRSDAPAAPEEEGLSPGSAAAFAELVANASQDVLERTLNQMNAAQLRSLAIALATQINSAETTDGEVADVGPGGLCALAVATAAQSFGTTRDAVLSADRHRAVTDARAVAMTAARRGGLTFPAIASYFGKDHTSVLYATNKVANNPRLNAVCNRIVDQLDAHYVDPTSIPAEEAAAPVSARSSTLQLAALDQARVDGARHQHDDSRRVSVPAAQRR